MIKQLFIDAEESKKSWTDYVLSTFIGAPEDSTSEAHLNSLIRDLDREEHHLYESTPDTTSAKFVCMMFVARIEFKRLCTELQKIYGDVDGRQRALARIKTKYPLFDEFSL
jgi:hypothetical protein